MCGQKKRADLHASGDFLLPSLEDEEKDEKGEEKERKDGSDCCWSFTTVRINFLISSLNHTQSPMTSIYILGMSQAICSLISLFPGQYIPRAL